METPLSAATDVHDVINNLIKTVNIIKNKQYLKFEQDDHNYLYNANKKISEKLNKKLSSYIYIRWPKLQKKKKNQK